MGRFFTLSGMVVMTSVEIGTTRIELVERPCGSTVGMQYVRVFENGVGVMTEKFSGSRADLAASAYEELVTQATRIRDTPKRGTQAEEIVYDAGGVQVIKVRGKPMCFRMLRGGDLVEEVTCAPQSWRKVQQQVVERAAAL